MEKETFRKITIALAIIVIVAAIVVLVLQSGMLGGNKPSGLVTISDTNIVQAQKTKIKAGYTALSYYLPLFVAKEKGFFEEQGLDAELVKFEATNQLMDALLQGKIQEGTAGYATLFAIESNTPGQFKTFGYDFETAEKYQNALLVPVNSPIKDITELQGKRIGTYTGTTQKLYIKLIFQKLGWQENKDYQIVQVATDLQLTALASGQFEALLTIEPYVTIAQQKGIGKVLLGNPRGKYILDPFPAGSFGGFSAQQLKRDPETAGKIKIALEKAAEFIQKNEPEARKLLTKYVPIDENVAMKVGIYNMENAPTESDKETVQKLADLLFEGKELKNKIDTYSMWLGAN